MTYHKHKLSNPNLYSTRSDDSDNDSLSWMREAMGTDLTGEEEEREKELNKKFNQKNLGTLKVGLSGFATDSELGFVSILSAKTREGSHRYTYTVVSPSDKDDIRSPEALCLIQLAGGLDLGTAVFPPDSLAKLVADHLDKETSDVESLSQKVTLVSVKCVKSETHNNNDKSIAKVTGDENDSEMKEYNSEERNRAIKESASKVLTAVKSLPGLMNISEEEVYAAMLKCANEDGSMDRASFSNLLEILRQSSEPVIKQSNIAFALTVSFSDNTKAVEIISTNAFESIALSLRYAVQIELSDECLSDEVYTTDTLNLLENFPFFKSVTGLKEDAMQTNSFISKMFHKEKNNL